MTSRYVGSNKGASTVATGFNATATTFSVATGEGARFPSPTGGNYTLIVLQNAAGVREIICVVGRSGDAMTVGIPGSAAANVLGRNYESIYGMAAAAWVTGDVVACRPTAAIGMGDHIIPTGTKMLFMQTAAPVGWTKDTTHNDKALRVVSGSVSSGGTVDFSAAFTSKTPTGTNAGTALTEAQLAAHTHTGTTGSDGAHSHTVTDPGHSHTIWGPVGGSLYGQDVTYTHSFSLTSSTNVTGLTVDSGGAHTHSFTSASTGSGSTHTHAFTGDAIDLAVKYADVIVATRD